MGCTRTNHNGLPGPVGADERNSDTRPRVRSRSCSGYGVRGSSMSMTMRSAPYSAAFDSSSSSLPATKSAVRTGLIVPRSTAPPRSSVVASELRAGFAHLVDVDAVELGDVGQRETRALLFGHVVL